MGERDYTLGIDFGGTKILAAVVDPQNKVLDRVKRKTRPELGVDAVLDRIARTAREAIDDAGVNPAWIASVGIGVPGPIDSETGLVYEAPNIGFKNINIKKNLEDRLGYPVATANDTNSGAWGEYIAGAGRGASSVLGVFVGTGIGGGLVMHDELFEGTGHVAGEIGHMCIDPDGPYCGCGHRGCLEALASRTAITRDIWTLVQDKGQKSMITDLVDKKGGQIRSGQLRKAYEEKDKVVCKVLARAAEYLGIGLASAASLLNPECIVLGGGVVTALGAPYVEQVRAAMANHTFKSVMNSTRLVMATLGDDAVLLGTAFLARRKAPSLTRVR